MKNKPISSPLFIVEAPYTEPLLPIPVMIIKKASQSATSAIPKAMSKTFLILDGVLSASNRYNTTIVRITPAIRLPTAAPMSTWPRLSALMYDTHFLLSCFRLSIKHVYILNY